MTASAAHDMEKDVLLSHFSLENLHEGVFWIRSNGQIFNVNQRACEMTGRTKEELLQMRVPELNASAIVQDFATFWKKLKQQQKIIFEAQHQHKDGHLYDVEITGNYIEHDGEEFTCSIVRYLGKEKMEQQLLRTISETTAGLTGKDFLHEIAKSLSSLLKMRFATIAQCKEGDTTEVRTVCIASGETIFDNIDYDTKGRPCELILQGKDIFVPKDVQKIFPEAKGIEASLGTPIYSSVTGKIIGHIIISHTEPVDDDKNQITIVKIFASRVGAELERLKAEQELQQKNEELKNRIRESELYRYTLENLNEDVYWVDDKGNFIQVNESACKTSGYSKEELIGMTVFDINPAENKEIWEQHWVHVKTEKSVTFLTRHKHKEGYLYDVEISNNYIEFDGNEYFCSVVRDIRKKRMEEELLKVVSEATAGLTGEDYFRELAKHVTATLGVRYSIVTECANDEKTRVRSLSYVDRQELKENIEYDLAGTPCEIVMKGKDYFCVDELEKIFPREKGIQSYIAVPIYSPTTGEVIGHIAGLDTAPMNQDQNQTSILKIFAARAGAEMDRLDALKKLERANDELKLRLNEIETLKNQLAQDNKYLQEEIKLNHNFEEIVSKSKNFHKVLKQIEQVASTDATVLIIGESGTGKELIARAVHNISNRSKRPLVKVNCAALPANLIESELFGHERGAFTGALERKIGRFELADGGTIFLDEIGELPVELQAKLLRILQEGEFERLGNPKTFKVNVRVIAATNRNLQQAIEKKEFREDLFYRLNVFPVTTPPLRERKEDIPLLVKHFIHKYEGRMGKKIKDISPKVIDALVEYDWPGNIRELENLIERALILTPGDVLEYGDWMPMAKSTAINNEPSKPSLRSIEEVEREHIINTLKQTNWKVSGEKGAAKILGLNPTTLEARMKKLGIVRVK